MKNLVEVVYQMPGEVTKKNVKRFNSDLPAEKAKATAKRLIPKGARILEVREPVKLFFED
jgi:hypothetical protein